LRTALCRDDEEGGEQIGCKNRGEGAREPDEDTREDKRLVDAVRGIYEEMRRCSAYRGKSLGALLATPTIRQPKPEEAKEDTSQCQRYNNSAAPGEIGAPQRIKGRLGNPETILAAVRRGHVQESGWKRRAIRARKRMEKQRRTAALAR
jgi:hypothetical protein